jgi:hypothetical protein
MVRVVRRKAGERPYSSSSSATRERGGIGGDDPAVVVLDSQPMRNPTRRGRFSLRRKKVKWAEGGASALPLTKVIIDYF